jgi:uncharacterized membrane protein
MTALVLGLIVFLGLHSLRIVADDWRTRTRERIGAKPFKMAYSLISVLSFALIVWGYGQARTDSEMVWIAPRGMYHAAAGLMLISMILLAGFHSKASHISVVTRHPMLWSVIIFAGAHLLPNGRVADIVLFGSFGVWAILDLLSCYARDRKNQTVYPQPVLRKTVINIVAGVVFYGVFAFALHAMLIGVSPIPGR